MAFAASLQRISKMPCYAKKGSNTSHRPASSVGSERTPKGHKGRCDICGADMPAWAVHIHKMDTHPDELKARGETIAGFDKKMLKIIVPGFAIFVVLFLLLVFVNASYQAYMLFGIGYVICLAVGVMIFTKER